jgi:hypothetical protein
VQIDKGKTAFTSNEQSLCQGLFVVHMPRGRGRTFSQGGKSFLADINAAKKFLAIWAIDSSVDCYCHARA